MRCLLINVLVFILALGSFAQPTGYYNGTEGKDGDELKSILHNLIKDHRSFNYNTVKDIFAQSDTDPDNSANIIMVYTGRSHPKDDYGIGANALNREHVWAKSHGGFADWYPMHSDVHNLKPADASVNQDRGNKDFDDGGVEHSEASGCYYTVYTWEPRDEVKGDIARIIFYMSTRYEGGNNEVDLEVVDDINTYPAPEHGRLSTLLEWNLLDPPDDFERNRNDGIYAWQRNRNPFIDNHHFVQLIWGGETASPVQIRDVAMHPADPQPMEPVMISASISAKELNDDFQASILWGFSANQLNNSIIMPHSGGHYSAEIPGQQENIDVFFQITAHDGINSSTTCLYSYKIWPTYDGIIIPIYNIQGQESSSPYENQIVTTTGIVTADFGHGYFIQDGQGAWNGIYVYDDGRSHNPGDSVIVTGRVAEYYGFTELTDISEYYWVSTNNAIPYAEVISTGGASEKYESVLVTVLNAECTDDDYHANYAMWTVNDGSGSLRIRNTEIYEYSPSEGLSYSIKGPLNYDYSEYKILLNNEDDVSSGTGIYSPFTIEEVSLFPVPARNTLFLNMNVNSDREISGRILNSLGVEIQRFSLWAQTGETGLTIDIKDFSAGYYYLMLDNSDSFITKKFIVF